MAARIIWKGAISFGLVHIPISISPATREDSIDFDWLDKRSMDPVGYKRINKATGEEVDKTNIVKGIQYEPGQYAVLSDEEIRSANPKATQTIDILAFVPAVEVPFVYLETPYYLAPAARGEKVYALLRDTLAQTHKLGIATVVLHSKQHLAAVIPAGPVLILNTLRWANEVRSAEEMPEIDKAAKPTATEKKMAAELVESMTTHWNPGDYSDTFKDDIMALVDRKVKAGNTATVAKVESAEETPAGAEIIDLIALLKKSLQSKGRQPAPESSRSRPGADKESADEAKPSAPVWIASVASARIFARSSAVAGSRSAPR